MTQNVVFLGATKGMGRALARRLAERGDTLFLLGRHPEELTRSAHDLHIRSHHHTNTNTCIGTHVCDLEDPASFEPALQAAEKALGAIDIVVLTAGLFATQEALEDNPALALRLMQVNFANTVAFCEQAKTRLLQSGGGSLCVFSSVAGERGRKPVVIYGASKAGLSHYLEGLDHKHKHQGLHVLTVKPGFVKTSMTAGLTPPPFAGEPDQVATDVLNALDNKAAVVYTPAPWRAIMAVIRHVPRSIMRRVGF